MCAVIVALIIHWLFLFLCDYPFYLSGSYIFLGVRMYVHSMPTEHEHTMTQPHKSVPADFYRPITPRVIVVWAARLPLSRLCCGLWLGFNGDEEEEVELRGLLHCVELTDRWTAQQPGGEHQLQPMFRSSGRSLPGPWENKGVRLHLFSVSVPWGIKGEDISSRPAWLGYTHLRGPFSPHSLRALFTHPADMACGTVVA